MQNKNILGENQFKMSQMRFLFLTKWLGLGTCIFLKNKYLKNLPRNRFSIEAKHQNKVLVCLYSDRSCTSHKLIIHIIHGGTWIIYFLQFLPFPTFQGGKNYIWLTINMFAFATTNF